MRRGTFRLKAIVFPIILLIVSLYGCEEDGADPAWDPTGLYNVYVEVTARHPVFGRTIDGPYNINYSDVHGAAVYLSEERCCHFRAPCPDEYLIYNMRIYKHDNRYFLYGSKSYINNDPDTTQVVLHLPLLLTDSGVVLDKKEEEVFSRSFRLSPEDNMWSTAEFWPGVMQFVTLNIRQDDDGVIRGSWFFSDNKVAIGDRCTMKDHDDQWIAYSNGEFATLTFERVGD